MFRNILLVLISLNVLAQTSSSSYRPAYVWDRTRGQGKLWLSWSPERRLGFTQGYLWAYHKGFREACVVYFDTSPPPTIILGEETPLQKCNVRELHYPYIFDHNEAKITAYYEKYPSDVDLPITWLFQAFSDSENKTPEEIHSAWAHSHNHP